jgi:hypothetical protein
MRQILETWHNRWLVVFSSFLMFVCAVAGGTSRALVERLGADSKLTFTPAGPMGYASVGAIALLFLSGMLANVGLTLVPPERRGAKICMVVVSAVLMTLFTVALFYGFMAWRAAGMGHGVSGGEEG